jgi:predicted O-linked N-acetylglucosamine transferase (SPINDLY family)
MPKKPVIPKRQSPNPKVNLRSAPLTSLLEQGLKLHRAGQLEAAAKIYEQIHAQQANHFDALQLLGSIAIKTKNYARAAELLKKAISIKPDFADAHFNFGIALKELKNTDAALHHYEKAIELKPDHANAYLNRGIILREMGRLDDALASYDQFISLKPDSAPGFNNRGIVLKQQKKIDEALASYNHAICLDPNYADAYNNRAILLRGLNRTDEAMANFEIAASLKPDSAEFFNNRGVALSQQNRLDEAIEKYDKAISLKPDYAEAFQNRGDALTRLNQFAAAQESFQKAISLNPDYGFLPGRILHGKLFICDWSEFEIEATKTIEKIKKGEKASDPFVVLSITGCPLIHRKSSEIFTQSKFPPNHTLGEIPKRTPGEKIRVGYFSADFRSHAVSYLTAELFEIHDRTRFEIIAFSLQGAKPNDPLWQRLTKAFDQFIEVTDKSDQEVAQLARDLKLDIAVDLGGFTQNSRTGIFAYRAAPIQINYLGFPGTMGSEYIDYIIADPVLIPPANQVHYTEKVIYLPDTYMVDDTNRQPSNRKFSKSELNLPEDRFIFCSLNNSYKFNQATLTIWAQILLTVKDSVLWLASHHAFFKNNLLNEFAKLNINPERIIFAERMDSIEDYLARYQLADLFLDTHPYNSHTTAVDALKAGLPILTLMGESFASRVAASLLSAIGLPELITTTPKDYQALAIELATQPEKLAALKQKLAENRLSMPLFNTPLFTKHLEMAYTQIMQRYWADLAPEHIEVH